MNDIVRRGFLVTVVVAATWFTPGFASAQDLQLEVQPFGVVPTGRVGVTLGDRGVLSLGGGVRWRSETREEEAGGQELDSVEVWLPMELEVYLADVVEGAIVPSVVAGAHVTYGDETWGGSPSGVSGLGGLGSLNREYWGIGAHLLLEAHYFFAEQVGVGLGAGPSITRLVYVDDSPGPESVHAVRLDWRASLVMRL